MYYSIMLDFSETLSESQQASKQSQNEAAQLRSKSMCTRQVSLHQCSKFSHFSESAQFIKFSAVFKKSYFEKKKEIVSLWCVMF